MKSDGVKHTEKQKEMIQYYKHTTEEKTTLNAIQPQ